MMRLKSKKGVTFVELLAASTITVLVVVGMINLITTIYRGIVSANRKTISLNLVLDKIETLKRYGFSGLEVTPDTVLSNLTDQNNPYPITKTSVQNTEYTLYTKIQYADENDTGSIVPVFQSELQSSDIKTIEVYINYVDDNVLKTSSMRSFIANSSVPSGGSTITGRMAKKKTGGTSRPPGQASKAAVYVLGHPEYTSVPTDADRGNYAIYNVQPGSYILYASGIGFATTYYAFNPVVVTDVAGDLQGIDFLNCPELDVSNIKGTVSYYDGTVTKTCTTNQAQVSCSASLDGISEQTNSSGFYWLLNVDPSITTVTLTAGAYVGASYYYAANYSLSVPSGLTTTANIFLTPVVGQLTSPNGYVKDATDHTTAVGGISVYFYSVANPLPTPIATAVTNGSGYYSVSPAIPFDNYKLVPVGINYIAEESKLMYISQAGAPVMPTLYVYPVGKVSGVVTDSVSGLPVTSTAIQAITNYGSGDTVATAFSTTNGAYTIINIPVRNDYAIKANVENSNYTVVNPVSGYYSRVGVAQGANVSGKNFMLKLAYKPIKGTLNFNGTIPTGVILSAFPSSVTERPDQFVKGSSPYYLDSQDSYIRGSKPRYETILNTDGSFSLDVPASVSLFNVYAYYSYLYVTPNTRPTAASVRKFYKALTNVAPGDTVSFTGSWTAY